MTKPEAYKPTPKEKIAELQATVSFLTNARNALISAGTVMKGENDKLHVALTIANKKLENLQKQYDADEKEFTESINDLEKMTTDVLKLSAEISSLKSRLESSVAIEKSNYRLFTDWQNKYFNIHDKLTLFRVLSIALSLPYLYVVLVWVIIHVRICLH